METVIRVTIIYIFLLFGLRILGKREFSQLTPLELVTLLLIPELVAQALVRDDFSLANAIIAVSTLFSLVFLSSLLEYHSRLFRRAVSSAPTVLVNDGQIITEHLDRERIDLDEIYSAMRMVGLSDLAQVRWVILETNGRLSIIPYGSGISILPSESEGASIL